MSDLIDELLQSSTQNGILGEVTHRGAFGVLKYEIDIDTTLASVLHKAEGHYVTLKFKQNFLWSKKIRNYLAGLVAQSLKRFFASFKFKKLKNILVVGLGNGNMICDSLGKLVCQKLFVLDADLCQELDIPRLSYVLPGVEGVNGVRSFDLVASLAKTTKPDLVVAIDSLTATSLSRLGFTIQLSDAGILPGGGVGNKKKAFNKSNLNLPVLSLGVPLLIAIQDLCPQDCQIDFSKEYYQHFTPKEIDYVIDKCAKIIADGINQSVYTKQVLNSNS